MQIETKRLKFREWQESDIPFLIDIFDDFDLVKNMTMPYPYTESDAQAFIKKVQKGQVNSYYFAVVRKDDGALVGGTNLTKNEIGEWRGGIYVHRKFRGMGYGKEIFTARAKFAFDVLKVKELRNGYHHFNEKSKNMQLAMGYKIVGEDSHFCPALKSNVKEIVTKLTKSDFEKYYQTLDFEFKVTAE